nr:alcohol acetyltransferase [Brevibacterium yomogidense]
MDNASNIFLAGRTDADPKVFRISAETDHEVDPHLLQQALDDTYDRYPLYHAVLRRGVFWYYLQDSDLRPVVTADELHTCSALYQVDRRDLLFRVVHHQRRVALEVFHALSDGTGALWFLTDLMTEYMRLRYPDAAADVAAGTDLTGADGGAADGAGEPGPVADLHANPGDVAEALVESPHGLSADSFVHYFRKGTRNGPAVADPPSAPSTGDSPQSAGDSSTTADTSAPSATPDAPSQATPAPRGLRALRRSTAQGVRHLSGVYRVKGTRTPDNRTRVVELTMAADQVLPLARTEGVAVTMYLTALFFEAIRLASGGLGRSRTLAASVPVNLRQFFPSDSPRNFFATVRVEHTYGNGADDLGSICRSLAAQFQPGATPEALEKKLRKFIRFERNPLLRVVPRPLKDVFLGLINRANNRGLSVAVSNLGRVTLPEPAESHVRRMMFHVSAVRPQFCSMSHDGILTISFTSPFTETDHVREFTRMLTDSGVDVTVSASRVTEAEVVEAHSPQVRRPGPQPPGTQPPDAHSPEVRS